MTATEETRPRRASGIWSPFRSLLLAQVMSAILGLVFWVLVARLVDAHDVGVAAAAISAQSLVGIVTVLGFGTTLIAELPHKPPARQRRILMRALLVVAVSSGIVGTAIVAASPLFSANLREALGNPIGATTFVLGIAGFAWALVVDDSSLAVQRSEVQVARNLVASSLRFPVTVVLLSVGVTDAHVLQVCWVLPLLLSIPFTLWRLKLPRGDTSSPGLLQDLREIMPLALRNHGLSLSLAAGSQMVPVVAGLSLSSVDNAEFAIAWLMATFVFLPPYLLATALFAHGAHTSVEEFRAGMGRTIPAALSLSFLLCVGAWVLGEPVLLIFGGDYSRASWEILALLVPAGLWMVIKDHLVVLWRTQHEYGLATRLAGSALALEILGAFGGAMVGGALGLCLGWLAAMVLELLLGLPWVRQAFRGVRWHSPLSQLRALRGGGGDGAGDERGLAAPYVAGVVALVLAVVAVGVWSSTRTPGSDRAEPALDSSGLPELGRPVETCRPSAERPGPAIDLNVQSATGDPSDPILSRARVADLVSLAAQAGATVISTTTSFRTMQPTADAPIRFEYVDRTIDAARAAGMRVRLQLVGMPDWALDDPLDDDPGEERQPPRSEAELERWSTFVTAVLRHLRGEVDYLEVWSEPNEAKWWPTGPDPVEFARLLQATTAVVRTVSPQTQVVSGGLASNDVGYLDALYDAFDDLGLDAAPFDLLGVHPFSNGAGPDDVDAAKRYEREPFGLYDANFSGFTGLHRVMTDRDDPHDVYVTQFGYSTAAGRNRPAVPDAERATYLTQALEQATCAAYVPVFSWYALHPTPWDPPQFALLDRRDRPNQTYAALEEWSVR
ncbi:oligosaccharide flippase family protein [Nocardioides flavescens]|uniref:Oligosaccharide flippase family protein n=1 Tax=Nocardioides flavescens TaxID=2691959 RepID=A0A6L7F1A1_9ACTN|nr:oligosaccharide flippase family protein [Nocardioides flavescens]MXG88724.1 oligosaccharide flippase family protein [Nocardioides flavescens]